MSEFIDQVTPGTTAIIWLTKDQVDVQNPIYKSIDYLLDGLLTSGRSEATPAGSSRVLLGKNFGRPLYVFIAPEIRPKEFESFVTLLGPQLSEESSVLVIEEGESSREFLKKVPEGLRKKLRFLK